MATRSVSFDDDIRLSFEEEWPEIARRLERFLTAKGVDGWLRADVIQETAARLYPRWDTLDHSQPLWNLTATIALRVVHNHRRKESRIELVPDPLPLPNDDVHVRGIQRAQLVETRSALQQLSTDQRRVLLAEVGEAALPGGTRNRINVVRLRARAKLREALGPWAPSAVALRLRDLRARVAQKRLNFEMHMPGIANSLVNVMTAATLGLVGAAAVGVEPPPNAIPAERTRALSFSEPVSPLRDRFATTGSSEPSSATSTTNRAKTSGHGTSGFVDGLDEWAHQRKDEVVALGEDGADLGKDVVGLGQDVVRLGEDVVRLGGDVVRLGEDVVRLGKDVLDDLP